jgi:hypothetical protein
MLEKDPLHFATPLIVFMNPISVRKLAIFLVLIQIVSIIGKSSHFISRRSHSLSFPNASNAATKGEFAVCPPPTTTSLPVSPMEKSPKSSTPSIPGPVIRRSKFPNPAVPNRRRIGHFDVRFTSLYHSLQNAVGTDHGLTLVFPDAQSGDLDNSIEDGMPESEVREIIYRLLQGFEDFDGIRILYPDIKSENILTITNSVHNMVLADFEFAVGFPEDCFGDEVIGSPFDYAPEI